MLTGFDVWSEPFKYFTRIPDECRVNFYVLVDFGAVDLNVNLAGALCVSAQVAGDAVVKAHVDGAVEFGLVVIVALALGRKFWRRSLPVEFGGSLLRVFGDVD